MVERLDRGSANVTDEEPGHAETAALVRRYQLFSQHAHDIILFVRPDGRIVDANAAAEQAYGYTREELTWLNIRNLRAGETVFEVAQQMQAADEAGLVFETIHRRKDGTTFPVEVSSRGADLPDGRLLLSIIRDITERKRAEEERERQARVLAVTQELAPGGVAYLDRDLTFVRVNSAYAALAGRSPEALMGRTFAEVFPDSPDVLDLLRRVRDTGEPFEMRELPRHLASQPEAGLRHFDWTIRPVLRDGGEAEALVIYALDVTDRVHQREQLLAAERARAELAETLNAEISHRTKNNLAMAASMLQLQGTETTDEHGELFRDAAARLLTFASIHEQLQTTQEGMVDLVAAVCRIAEAVREVFAAQQVAFSVEGEVAPLPSRFATNLAIVANELITNGAKHGGSGGAGRCEVRVRLEGHQGKLRLSVWNSGSQVPAGFSIAKDAHLGLRLVLALVQDQYHGTFTLAPEGEGTLATVEIPLPEATPLG